jgi:DNA polymerase V
MPPATYVSLSLQSKSHRIPLGQVAAGFSVPRPDYLEVGMNLHQHVVKNPESTFFLRISGDSMYNAGMFPGDILVVDRSLSFHNNTIAVVFYHDQFLVKRVLYADEKIYLKSENKNCKTLTIEIPEDLQLWGIVTHVVHRVR